MTPDRLPSEARYDLIGLAALMRIAYAGQSLQPAWDGLMARLTDEPGDAAALMDLSTILMLSGQREKALEVQASAIGLARIYRRPLGRASGPRVLAFVIAGDFMANTPLDFLLEGSDIELWLVFLDADGRPPADVPDHDLAFMAVGESPTSQTVLKGIELALRGWPRPVMNGHPDRVAALTRDGVAAMFETSSCVVAPPVFRSVRAELVATAQASGCNFPIIARPIGSHAGQGLEKLDRIEDLAAYAATRVEGEFYISPFVDYASDDGLFRKQRIAFVMGRPFISHMAVSEHWMVHYLSAGMTEDEAKRAEEADFMRTFDTAFAAKHAAALSALAETIGLDYFGIDCAETQDGRLLLFEADVAMIVHALDPDPPFGYKKIAMKRLFGNFQAAASTLMINGVLPGTLPFNYNRRIVSLLKGNY